MSTVILLPESRDHDVGDMLTGFLDLHRAGNLGGFVICLALRGQRYYCDVAGTLERNPLISLGAASLLVDEMRHRIRREARDTVV